MSILTADIIFNPDRRAAERRKTNMAAKALLPNTREALPCVVLDISSTGARVQVEETDQFLPTALKLYITKMSVIANCEQRWRKGREIGLEFRTPIKLD